MIKVIGFDLGGVYMSDCWSRAVREKIAEKLKTPKDELERRNSMLNI